MDAIEKRIQDIIDFETRAWNNKDAEALVSIFHPDMVWLWPKDENAHDPVGWVIPWVNMIENVGNRAGKNYSIRMN
ncbi:MAG: nuclear transport factor 2 family protein [Candidatus Neomarinimicrobiota bacterium]